MRVGADAKPVAVFAVVEVLVLVAQDRQAGTVGQFVAAGQLGQRRGLDVLVGQRQQRHGHADHRADLRPQKPAQETTMSAGDDAVRRCGRR